MIEPLLQILTTLVLTASVWAYTWGSVVGGFARRLRNRRFDRELSSYQDK